jgi:hypothetical protein
MVVKRTYIAGMTGSSSRVNTRVIPPPTGSVRIWQPMTARRDIRQV